MDPGMVSQEEIERVAALMRIDIRDHGDYVKGVGEMIAFFRTLDEAGVYDEEIVQEVIPMGDLRADQPAGAAGDKSVPDAKEVRDALHRMRDGYVRAPSPA